MDSSAPTASALPNPSEIRRRLERAGGPAPAAVGEADAALWDVTESVLGRHWRLSDCPPADSQAIAAACDVPEIVARLLALRGVGRDVAERYLSPTLRDLMPAPATLKDMDTAIARLARAVERDERVCVFADYDVDGATSAALMLRLLRALGLDPMLYVPDRIAEGYGPSAEAFARLAEAGTDLVITVDCGVAAVDALEAAQASGLDVVVIDHHLADEMLPPAVAIVNPNRLDDASGLGALAAVGVTFMVCVGLVGHLRREGFAGDLPDLRQWLDLVVLGTVCDVVPLTGLNRAFVVQGLKVMAQLLDGAGTTRFAGLPALAQVAGLSERPSPYHLGFILGPRINAGGRVGQADLGARLLTTEDPEEALRIARELDAFNAQRRDIEADVLADAIAQGEAALAAWPARPVLVVQGEGWHAGVIGIVAGRLKDRFERPVLALGIDGTQAKGSARSVAGVDLGAAVIAARDEGLLLKGGGHAMAAGLTVAADGIDALDRFLCARLAMAVAESQADLSFSIDAIVSLPGANRALFEAMQAVGPFGAGAPEPVIAIRDAHVEWVQVVGEAHLRVTLSTPTGARLKAMAFRALGTPIGDALVDGAGMSVHVAGHLRADNYKGRSDVQLHIMDLAHAGGAPCAATY
ncbi:MAG: single-stranded-DNA-specific exonuclease RecJ [Alphaproteobacteria bacterium]